MRQKGAKSLGGSTGFRKYDVNVGCFLSLRQLCQKAKYRWGNNEVTKNMNQEKPVEEVFFGNLRFANEKLPSPTNAFIQLQISQQ